MLFHFIVPSGAGKTTVAKLLSVQMEVESHDLDEYFMHREGDISDYIEYYGYDAYVLRNIELYIQLGKSLSRQQHHILVCSSGFMTYTHPLSDTYIRLKQQIILDPYTFLFLPSLDKQCCIQEIVKRQMGRSYLKANKEKESTKINKRIDHYLSLPCRTVITDQLPCQIVAALEQELVQLIAFYG